MTSQDIEEEHLSSIPFWVIMKQTPRFNTFLRYIEFFDKLGFYFIMIWGNLTYFNSDSFCDECKIIKF